MAILDGDNSLGSISEKKIQEYIKTHGNLYPNCAIMFAIRELYPRDALHDIELIKKTENYIQKIREDKFKILSNQCFND